MMSSILINMVESGQGHIDLVGYRYFLRLVIFRLSQSVFYSARCTSSQLKYFLLKIGRSVQRGNHTHESRFQANSYNWRKPFSLHSLSLNLLCVLGPWYLLSPSSSVKASFLLQPLPCYSMKVQDVKCARFLETKLWRI